MSDGLVTFRPERLALKFLVCQGRGCGALGLPGAFTRDPDDGAWYCARCSRLRRRAIADRELARRARAVNYRTRGGG